MDTVSSCDEKTRLRKREWRIRNKDKLAQYRRDNRDRIKEKKRIWESNNQDRVRGYNRNNRRVRRERDPSFKVLGNLRCRLLNALNGVAKSGTTRSLIGCSQIELMGHIESLWLPGMSWENYGPTGWHIDHVKPCASFNLLDHAQQKECFHFTNLQPLWAVDNLRKGGR